MIIVNLTTTSTRLELCGATLWSLVNQAFLPDRINVWVSREPYLTDQGIQCIPTWILELNKINNIIHLKYTENTGPYRKIFPALKVASDEDILVYADDDVIYGREWLQALIKNFSDNDGKYVVASRVRLRNKNVLGLYQSYNRYNICSKKTILGNDFIITGVGGCVLYKKHINQVFINDDSYLKIAPKTDDLWISKLLMLSETKILVCPSLIPYIQEIQHSNFALSSTNTLHNKNGGLFSIYHKIKSRIMGYAGIALSNNDKAIKEIDLYFKNNYKL